MPNAHIDDPESNVGLQAAMIAEQNDAFRTASCGISGVDPVPNGRFVITRGIHAEGPEFQFAALQKIAAFNDFGMSADPYGWHEMGEIEVFQKRVWWKIDLYDENYAYGSEAPHDPEKTRRVLTVLFPSEY